MSEFTAKELEFRSKHVEALRQASNNLHWFAKVVEAHNGDLLRAAVEVIDIAHDAVERTEAENAALKKQLEEAQSNVLVYKVNEAGIGLASQLIKELEARNSALVAEKAEINKQLEGAEAQGARVIAEKYRLIEQLEEHKRIAASDANDWRMLQDRLRRLTDANGRLIRREAQLLECVRGYARHGSWLMISSVSDPRRKHFAKEGPGWTFAESCLRSLGLLDTDERSGEGC